MDIYFFDVILSVMIMYMSILNVGMIKLTKRQLILPVGLSLIFAVILNPDFELFANALVICIASAFLFWKTRNILFSIGCSIMGMVICIISSQFASLITVGLLKVDPSFIRNNLIHWCFHSLIIAMIAYLISKFIGIIIHKVAKNISFRLSRRYTIFILFGLFLILSLFYYQIFIVTKVETKFVHTAVSSGLSLLLLVFLLGAVYVLIIGMKNSIESAHKEALVHQLQDYTANLENMSGNMRQFRHDYISIVATLYGYIEAKNLDALEEYFTTRIVPLKNQMESSKLTLDRLKNIRIFELKGLVGLKLMQAQEWGIDVRVEVEDEIDKISLDIMDLTRIVGILIDNAVEACCGRENPVLKFILLKEGNVTTMLIQNSVHDPLPPFEEMRKEGFSTKGSDRGLGLYTVHQIMDKYENATIKTRVEDGEFIQELRFLDK